MTDAAPAVLITGATSGLGRYLAAGARELRLAGPRPRRDPARVAGLVAELGGGAQGLVADLARLSEVADLAAQVRAQAPRLHVLVNNAASASARQGRGGR